MKRLEYDANTQEEVVNYFQTRARQLLSDGFVWQKDLTPAPGGLITTFKKGDELFKSYYCYASCRGKGLASMAINSIKERIVTTHDCHIEEFLIARNKAYVMAGQFCKTPEYREIQSYYNDQKDKISQRYFMNHIDEGLFILNILGASDATKRAFCLHPLLQKDQDLKIHWNTLKHKYDAEVIGLVMEYRNIANKQVELSAIDDVNEMSIADKIQNYKDFLICQHNVHKDSEEIDKYLTKWLHKLAISKAMFKDIYLQLKEIEFLNIHTVIENESKLEELEKLTNFSVKQIAVQPESKRHIQSVGFRRPGMDLTDFKYITPMNEVSEVIINKSMNINYREFYDFLHKTLHRQLSAITIYNNFDRKYAVFQLKENYKNIYDIEYYEVCYSVLSTESKHGYYLFRFYIEKIEPSCVLEKEESQFPYLADIKEAVKPKIIISTHYKDFSKLSYLFLQNYTREISKYLNTSVTEADDNIINLIDMVSC